MSATSGISIHPDLQQEIATANDNVRFRKLIIRNESIVQEQSINIQSNLSDDLNFLQEILRDDEPAYILAKQDNSSQWLLITYVPDTARVKEKMLYASSRSSLVKILASPSTLSVSLKSELTPSAYLAHLSQQAAPPLISAREREMQDVQAVERADAAAGKVAFGNRAGYLGGAGIALEWTEDAVQAAEAFESSNPNNILIFKIDTSSEILSLIYSGSCDPDNVSAMLPAEVPAYALYTFKVSPDSEPNSLFIYSCPTSSPIKQKMLYSSASRIVQNKLKELGVKVSRKLETSDPREVRGKWMEDEIGTNEGLTNSTSDNMPDTKRPFAKPRGPPRKNR